MSTPPFLALPAGVRAATVATERLVFAALLAVPGSDDHHRPAAPGRAPVVLVPGFTGSKEDFLGVLASIVDAGHQVAALDQRGQYQTAGGEPPEGWTMEAFAADLLAFCATVGSGRPVHLLGHSFGGLVARAAVLAEPAAFASLTLLDSGPAAFEGDAAELLLRMADGLDAFGIEPVYQAKQAHDIARGWVPPADPEVDIFLRARFLANDPAALAAKARLLASAPDDTHRLARLALAILVAYGEADDAWNPTIQAEMASRLDARVVSIPGAAHSPAAERPRETARVLVGFWGEVEGAA